MKKPAVDFSKNSICKLNPINLTYSFKYFDQTPKIPQEICPKPEIDIFTKFANFQALLHLPVNINSSQYTKINLQQGTT